MQPRVAALRAAARTALARGASDAATLLLRRALEEPVAGEDRADLLVELGQVETLVDGPAGAARLSEAYALLDDDRERARVGLAVARIHVFVSPPGVATHFAARAAAATPAALDDERQGLVALQRITGFMHGLAGRGLPLGSRPADPATETAPGCWRPYSPTSTFVTARTEVERSSCRTSRSTVTG